MHIEVLLFAALAERAGARQQSLQLASGAQARAVWEHYARQWPEMGELGQRVLLAVNGEFAGAEQPLREGDCVALLPPMSGGSEAPSIRTGLFTDALPAPPAWDDGGIGAVARFEGIVRHSTPDAPGRAVVALEYEAYAGMAERRMAAIADEAIERWSLRGIEIVHRTGRLAVGEISVRVTAAAGHRDSAFAACRFAIDTLKRSVPIWKKEIFTDGSVWSAGEDPHHADFTPPARTEPRAAHKG